jgi:hypothetical protein
LIFVNNYQIIPLSGRSSKGAEDSVALNVRNRPNPRVPEERSSNPPIRRRRPPVPQRGADGKWCFPSAESQRRHGRPRPGLIPAGSGPEEEFSAKEFVNPRDFQGSYLPDGLLALPRKELSPGAKLVFVYILRCFNRSKGYAWPSEPTIARETGFSAKQVCRYVKELKEKGHLAVTPTAHSNHYRFPWRPWMDKAKLKPTAITRKED